MGWAWGRWAARAQLELELATAALAVAKAVADVDLRPGSARARRTITRAELELIASGLAAPALGRVLHPSHDGIYAPGISDHRAAMTNISKWDSW